MRREAAPLAGELSGHIFFADRWDGTDDALYAALRLLCRMSQTGERLTEFRRALPPLLATPEFRVPCPDATKAEVVSRTARRLAPEAPFDPAMGLRMERPQGWWLIPASGAEPKLTLRAEGRDGAALEALVGEMRQALAAAGVAAEF